MKETREFHLFGGIGGGIYGGQLLGHKCVGAVEIDPYCQAVLKQRQKDKWMDEFPIYGDIKELSGRDFIGKFDVLCGGFPCQAFSHAARGKNIPEKNLWGEMLRFVRESKAPIVFGENVTLKAITKAVLDLIELGYSVRYCKLSCGDLGADHRRDRYWLLAVNGSNSSVDTIEEVLYRIPRYRNGCWRKTIEEMGGGEIHDNKRAQLKGVGNAQSPIVAACAFRVLANRFREFKHKTDINVSKEELDDVYVYKDTWIKRTYGNDFGYVHTPTATANYSASSMMKHKGCKNFVEVFGVPTPANAEYLLGFPQGASTTDPMSTKNFTIWKNSIL